MKFLHACGLVLAVACCPRAGVAATTKHYSFSNGYPTTTTRQTTQATAGGFGASVSTTGGARSSASGTKDAERELVGTVSRVDSGDVIWVTPTGGRRTKVLLDRIDAPERGQNYGVEAKKFLFDLVNGRQVTVRYARRDSSGSVRGTVYLAHEKGLVDVNLTMLKNGCAWCVGSAQDRSDQTAVSLDKAYSTAHEEARAAKRGLWCAQNPVSPSEWRKVRK